MVHACIAKRILKNEIIRRNNIRTLCRIELTEFTLLTPDNIDYGATFPQAIGGFHPEVKTELKCRASDFLKLIFTGLQARLQGTLSVIDTLEPFTVKELRESAPKVEHYKKPFFKTDPATLSNLENQMRQAILLLRPDDTTEAFWVRMYYTEVAETYKYRDLAKGVIKMFSLPISNAEVERTFSVSNFIKSPRRSLIKKDLLESILYCKFGLLWLDSNLSDFVPPKNLVMEALKLKRTDYL